MRGQHTDAGPGHVRLPHMAKGVGQSNRDGLPKAVPTVTLRPPPGALDSWNFSPSGLSTSTCARHAAHHSFPFTYACMHRALPQDALRTEQIA